MSIVKTGFGTLADGRRADLYTLTNASGASVSITNYGGTLVSVNVPDKDGKLDSVVLGYNDVNGYVPVVGYIGALIGRVGNRIADGECELNGVKLHLAKNEGGATHLHGGNVGFDRHLWEATPIEGICQDQLILRYLSLDGEEGYPGNLRVMVTYTFTDDNELMLRYEAVSDKDTLCNLTNHTYFNLAGESSGKTVEDHVIEMNCDTFTVVDGRCIPTGEQRDVTGTPFDFREPARIGDRLAMTARDEQLGYGNGIDHNLNINDFEAGLRFAAEVTDPASGRVMDVFTDMPAVQFYTANGLRGVNPGRSGRVYAPHEGFCLETQFAPDSINHPEFIDSVLRAGEKYDFTTIFAFDVAAEE